MPIVADTRAVYLLVQSTVVLAAGYHPGHSVLGIAWTAAMAAAMFALAAGKARTGQALDNPVLRTEGRLTMIDGILAVAVLLGLALNARSAGGGPIPPPGTCWCTTRPARCGRSSRQITDGGTRWHRALKVTRVTPRATLKPTIVFVTPVSLPLPLANTRIGVNGKWGGFAGADRRHLPRGTPRRTNPRAHSPTGQAPNSLTSPTANAVCTVFPGRMRGR
jgi:hypothetical protein